MAELVSTTNRFRFAYNLGDAGLIAAVAALYFVTGWLGLLMAVPPGYVTPVWPPSGLAMGAVLVAGPRLWPGIFLGAAILNAFNAETTNLVSIALACTIAMGSTAQAIVGSHLIRGFLGSPVRCDSMRDVMLLMILAGPVACMLAATVGQAALFTAGLVEAQSLGHNWLTWWFGDTLGVFVFLPLVLLSPWHSGSAVKWKGRPLVGFSFSALATVLTALGLTFFAWFATHTSVREKDVEAFGEIAKDSESALLHRMDLYSIALEAGAGYFSVDDLVTVSEWRRFTKAFKLEETLPGINGIGFILPVQRSGLDVFAASKSQAGLQDLTIHPETSADELFIITLIEPRAPNIEAVGLDIAFEANRRLAAIKARDEGIATITERIYLVQDDVRRAGFLMLRPLYRSGVSLDSIEDRRAAFRGWIYAPFIAQRFLEGLTASQDNSLTLSVFDGSTADPDAEIYASAEQPLSGSKPQFRIEKTLRVLDQDWTVVWESTPLFEANVRRREAEIVLASGLSLTGLLGALLISAARRETVIRDKVVEKTTQLIASEGRFRAAMKNAPIGMALVGPSGEIVDSNDALSNLMGYSRDELARLRLRDLVVERHWPDPSCDGAFAFFDAVSRSDIPFLRKDGHEVWGMLTSSIVEGPTPKESYAIVQILDVSERRKVAKLQHDFIATVSHELRTPLTSIRGAIGLLRVSIGDTISDGTDRLVTMAQNNAERLGKLVDDILDVEKLASGKMEIALEPLDATELVATVVADVDGYCANRDVALDIIASAETPKILSNRDRFTQVLTNLISNAVKFSSAGDTVTVGITEKEDTVVVTVSDTGPGIPAEFQERIFSRFAQANSTDTRNPGGTGLGLNISKELVETMGGQIGFDSEEGRGSSFWFSFPVADKREPSRSTIAMVV